MHKLKCMTDFFFTNMYAHVTTTQHLGILSRTLSVNTELSRVIVTLTSINID